VLYRVDHGAPGIKISDEALRPRIRPVPTPF
jgi:hypothetical protein